MRPISHRAFLKLCAAAPWWAAAHASGCRIDWDDERQVIDGFGLSGAFRQAAVLRAYPDGKRAALLDLLFSRERGAGFSAVRNAVGDGGRWGGALDGPTLCIEPEPGVWNWTGDEDQLWFMGEASGRGCDRFIASVWSPPAWMKTNGDTTHGGRLKPACLRAYAEYLAAYVAGYRQHHGINIYAISPANEPENATNYSSCLWSGEELRVLVRDHIAPVFAVAGVTAKLILGEHSTWSEEPCIPALTDPAAASRVDIVATHAYTAVNKGFEPIDRRAGPLPYARRANKTIWQTEVSAFDKNDSGIADGLYWAQLVHAHLVDQNVSAWFYWWAVNTRDSRSALIRLFPDSWECLVAKRLFTIGQFARFVRPGFCRVTTAGYPPEIQVSAFKRGLRRIVVAINATTTAVAIMLPGLSQARAWRTSAGEDLADLGLMPSHAPALRADLIPQSITTFIQ